MSNLPNWKGADRVYSRAYRILGNMARDGHAHAPIFTRRGKMKRPGYVSLEMAGFIDALNDGDEERIKWNILNNLRYLRSEMI